MKGVMGFLEKAGLVRLDAAAEEPASASTPSSPPPQLAERARAQPPANPAPPVRAGAPLKLDDIYAHAGVPPSLYPAERLLRLIEGLSAMDEGTRRMAIQAMDAADESWTIDDPLDDARHKTQALALHAELLSLNLQALERDTQSRVQAVGARRDQVVGDIRQQMSELDALMNREMARAAEEIAAQQAQLQAAREHTAGQLASLSELGQRLVGLTSQFTAPSHVTQE
jgi:hypothetical protein